MNLTTTIGPVEVHVNSGTQVYIGCPSGERVTVRGIKYFAYVHLELVDGEWKLTDYRNLHASRWNWRKEPSASARKAILAAFTAAWVDYLKEHPEVLAEADRRNAAQAVCDLKDEIEALERDIVERRATLAEKRNLLASLTS